ncbi:MAG: glycosyltransferase [Rhodobacteraceae bacterium]|nr:glycosyltransferase [Paracoccaceae bacterium]
MKIVFVAVFDSEGISSNSSQATGLAMLGHDVIKYNYRIRASKIGVENRDKELIDIVSIEHPDLVIFAKTNTVDISVFHACKKYSKVCYWFPDPLSTFDNDEFLLKAKVSDFFCCDMQKQNVFDYASNLNDKCFKVADGYDPKIEKPRHLEQDIDVSFIGNLYNDRKEKLNKLNRNITVVSNAFGITHSEIVSRSKININFCTANSSSDRTYKVLAAGGFYITEDWENRAEYFVDGQDLIICNDIDDLRTKIDYYLNHPNERARIAKNGVIAVKKFSRHNWAKRIVEIYNMLFLKIGE